MPPFAKRFKKGKHDQRSKKKHKMKSSLMKINKKPFNNKMKRPSDDIEEFEIRHKQIKPEDQGKHIEDKSSSSENEDDDMKLLLDTFGTKVMSKKSLAVDSSDDSISDEELLDIDDLSSKQESDTENESVSIPHNVQQDIIEKGELDLETQKEDDKLADLNDPFAKHLFYEVNDSLLTSVQSVPMLVNNHLLEWPQLGKLQVQIPKCIQTDIPLNSNVMERKIFASPGSVPVKFDVHQLESLHVKMQLINNVANANKEFANCHEKFPLSPLQTEIFSIINYYQDFYFSQRSFENSEEIRFVYCLHLLNHILKTRTKVLHHNAKLTKKDEVPEEFRDQGLARPKILVVVPFRDSAYKIISLIINILISESKGNVLNKNRFLEEFTGHEITFPKKNPKPEDYEKLFTGNTGDDFRIGITITRKSLKLFANFYSSDIIIASPLGLRTIIGAEGESERDFDFLASIELLIMDQTEIFLMQNWDHIFHLFNHLHLQPKESHGTDFSRVRTWCLNGWSKYYRQTLIFSSIILPEINTIFNKKCFNYAGKVKCAKNIGVGSICQVFNQLPHVFQKFQIDNVAQSIEARFDYFINKILPQQREPLMRQTLIFISNYFDFVKVRNYFKKEDIGFVQVCEYSKEGKVARARDMFFHGDAHFLLYTERYHFFNRVRIKGIRHLIFYQPPTFPHFYYEMCNLMQEANMNKKIGSNSNMTVTILYSKYDHNQIAEIVGTERALKMIQSERNVHMLVTDGK